MTGTNALHIAVENNNDMIVSQLIQSGYPLDEKKFGGYTALMISLREQKNDIISKALIVGGADVNQITYDG